MVVVKLAPDLLRALLETCIYITLLPVQGSVFQVNQEQPKVTLVRRCIWLCTCCSQYRIFILRVGKLGCVP